MEIIQYRQKMIRQFSVWIVVVMKCHLAEPDHFTEVIGVRQMDFMLFTLRKRHSGVIVENERTIRKGNLGTERKSAQNTAIPGRLDNSFSCRVISMKKITTAIFLLFIISAFVFAQVSEYSYNESTNGFFFIGWSPAGNFAYGQNAGDCGNYGACSVYSIAVRDMVNDKGNFENLPILKNGEFSKFLEDSIFSFYR